MMNIQKMMQQAKAMQDKMQVMQVKLGETLVEGTAGGGAVKAVMTCKGECQSFTVDPSVMNPAEKDLLEDLIKAAINDSKAKADARLADETQKMMSELGLPAGVQLPF